jgi:hypothetical protein
MKERRILFFQDHSVVLADLILFYKFPALITLISAVLYIPVACHVQYPVCITVLHLRDAVSFSSNDDSVRENETK